MSAPRVRLGRAFLPAGILLSLCLGTPPAQATLGADVASIDANVQHLGGTRQVQKLASGERHDVQLPSGMVVHEYVSAKGAVYAITWSGPRMPDLRELLGPYFEQLGHPEYRRKGMGHHHLDLSGADLEVRAAGRRSSFAGRAWVPSLVPAGVDVNALDGVSK